MRKYANLTVLEAVEEVLEESYLSAVSVSPFSFEGEESQEEVMVVKGSLKITL